MPTAKSDDSPHVEYRAPNGDHWRIEDGASLINEFGLAGAQDLPGWHQGMVGEGRKWEVTRRYFGVAPLLAKGDDAVAWVPERIAKELSLHVVDVESEIDAAIAFWRQKTLVLNVADTASATSQSADAGDVAAVDLKLGENTAWLQALELDDSRIDSILQSHGFADLADNIERRQAAARLIEFDHLLSEPESRSLATTVIRQELDLAYLNRELGIARNGSKAGDGSRKVVTDLIKDRNNLLTNLTTTLKAMGETPEQKPSAQKRVAFQDCIAYLTKAAQVYYAEGDNRLIDGMYTAAEINFMMTPVAERPLAYDPQHAIEVFLAQMTLWEPEFEGHRLNRATSRTLRALFREAVEAMNERDGVSVRSLEGDDYEHDDELAEELAKTATASPVAVGESAAPSHPSPLEGGSAAQQHATFKQASQRGSEYVAAG